MIVSSPEFAAGIDTHRDQHSVTVINVKDGTSATKEFPAHRKGYAQISAWLSSFPGLQRVGIEATGSYGAGIARHLQRSTLEVLEVVGPDRDRRRRQGKSDQLDSLSAAEAAFAARRCGPAKDRNGNVECLRALRVARTSAVKSRPCSLQVLRSLLVSAPSQLREAAAPLTTGALLKHCSRLRPGKRVDLANATKRALRSMARRCLLLDAEIKELDANIKPLIEELAPSLVALCGVGPETASELVLTAGSNRNRIRSEAAFAMMCGVAPIPASSGTVTRHRLNRGGNRKANSALHVIAINRLQRDEETLTYINKRLGLGNSKREALRMLKRYIARRVYRLLIADGAM